MLRFRALKQIGRQNIFRQTRSGNGCNRIDMDIVLDAFQFEGVHQSDQGQLGG